MTNLKQFIEENGIKQRRIAQMIGLHESTLSNYIRGLVPPDEETRTKIVTALTECTGKDVTVEMLWPAEVQRS